MATARKRTWWERLFSPEPDFYALLEEQAAKTLEGVQALVHWMYTGDAAKALRVQETEHEADDIRHHLAEELAHVFSPPLDREDIHYLSRRLDEVINYTHDIVREMEIFGLEPDEAMREMSELLLEGTTELYEGFQALRDNPEAAVHHAQTAKKIENRVERRYRLGVKTLFEGDDFKDILMRREVYRHISNTADRIDEAADALWFAVMKHL
ncbi:MAG TPA: DUF47 family protein [Armatimonadetes bacterium]|nr:DUF47 family protein [Armatimonadota bacterium]